MSRSKQTTAEPNPASGQLSVHDRVLREYPIPAWLVSQSLLDHKWRIRLGDTTKYRAAEQDINFAVAASPGRSFADPLYINDLLTAKLLLVHAIRASVIGSSKVASIFVRNYLQFARWRIGIGLFRNADLTEDIIGLLRRSIQERGISGLPPVAQALATAQREIDAGSRTLPSYPKGNQHIFAANAFVQELGLPNMTSVPPALRKQIRELAVSKGLVTAHTEGIDVGAASEDLVDEVPTENRVAAFLKPVETLHTFVRYLQHDPIGCIPFVGQTVQAVAASIATREADRTFTIPAFQACYLIDQALTWVTQYSDEIFRYAKEVERRIRELTGPDEHWRPHERAIIDVSKTFVPRAGVGVLGSPWPMHPSYHEPTRGEKLGPSLRTVMFEYLLIACVIVIAAFAARRHDELDSLRDDCIIETDVGLLLNSYIEKTIHDIEQIPVPHSVKLAVDILLVLSAGYRERTGEHWIVAFSEMINVRISKHDIDAEGVIRSGKVDFYRCLERFSAFVGTPALADGAVWTPLPHQFRRWFGVIYYNRYRFPQLTALAYFFRHSDINQTRRYVTERAYGGFIREKDETRARERLNDISKAGEELRFERFLDVLEGREQMTGFGGEFLKRELEKCVSAYSDRLEIVDDRDRRMTLMEAIAPVVASTKLEPNELGHTYCKCGTGPVDLAQAECLKAAARFGDEISLEPDSAYSTDTTCGGCAHSVYFGENDLFIDVEIARLEESSACARCSAVRSVEQERLDVLREQRANRKRLGGRE